MLEVGAVALGIAILVAAVWVWRWDPRPGSGVGWLPIAHLPGYSKILAIALALVGIAWLGVVVGLWLVLFRDGP